MIRARRGDLVAACALGVALWQGWTARDAEKRQLRAYLVVVPPRDVDELWMGKSPTYSVRAEDGGETPAYLTVTILHVSTDFIDSMGYVSRPKKFLFDIGRVGGGSVFRDKTASVPAIDGLTKEQPRVTAALAGGQKLIVWGRVSYDDVFFGHHWVDYCYYLGPEDKTATACFDGNDVDGQPPILFSAVHSAVAHAL